MNSYYLLNCLIVALKNDRLKADSQLSKHPDSQSAQQAKQYSITALYQANRLYRIVPCLNTQLNALA